MTYRPDIDGLRAVAILAVVGFHAFPGRVRGGFVGVDIFFVVSGFLISGIILDGLAAGTFSFGGFYARRVKRLFPALVVVLVACGVFGWFALLPHEYRLVGKHIAAGAGFVSNLVQLSEMSYFAGAERRPLVHLWSLSLEEQFYLLWPGLMFVAWKRRWNLLAVTLVVAILSFGVNVAAIGAHPVAAFYLPITRLWELAIGGALACIGRSGLAERAGAPGRLHDVRAFAGMSLIAAALVGVERGTPFPGWWALLPTVGTALLIAAGPGAWLNRRVLSRRPVVLLGLISYPLYLWHWPLVAFPVMIDGGPTSTATRSASIVIGVALAWLTYTLIERPIRLGRSRLVTPLALCALMVFIGGAGWYGYRYRGLTGPPPRLVEGDPVNASFVRGWLAPFAYDFRASYRYGTCFLVEMTQFAPDCVDSADGAGKPMVFLWGDSHAAHLYPGLRSVAGDSFRIAQYTAGACRPIPGRTWPKGCSQMYIENLARIRTIRPDTVMLAAHWREHEWRGLHQTIADLQRLDVRRILVVGPVPEWTVGLPRNLARFIAQASPGPLPARMTFGLRSGVVELDGVMRAELAHVVIYVSAVDILCESEGCLIRTGGSTETLTAWDESHLTDAGSRFLVSRMPVPRGR